MNNINEALPKLVFVGTFPPTDEGIATFNEDLIYACQNLLGRNALCSVCAVNLTDTSPYYFDSKVEWEIDQSYQQTYAQAAEEINADESVKAIIIQHEYGIYGGIWGEYIVDFMKLVDKPIITILHSVLASHPNNPVAFKRVTREVLDASSALIVLSKSSRDLLIKLHPETASKTHYIPHGIHPVNFSLPENFKKELGLGGKTVLTTFGLLSRDKGIEHVLKALPKVIKKNPNVLYQVLGQTHPIIRRKEGEKYRIELTKLVKKLSLRKHVRFIDKYLSLDELIKYLKGTDLYISTSTNRNQAVSGTLSYALGTGRAVVSTEFQQSREMVKKNTGRIVPPLSPREYTTAINELLADKKRLARLHRVAYNKTRSMLWTNVAKEYIAVTEAVTGGIKDLSLPPIDLSYLKKLTKKYGLLQFAKYDIPDDDFGYTVDDNARALVVANWLISQKSHPDRQLVAMARKYFNFIKHAQTETGNFVNYFNENLAPTAQNNDENGEEPYSRAMWALAETMVNRAISPIARNGAKRMWMKALPEAGKLTFLRPKAFCIKSVYVAFHHPNDKQPEAHGLITKFADDIVAAYYENRGKNWHWFEDNISYNNGILVESLFLAYKITKNREYLRVGKRTLKFLIKKTFMGTVYVPVGQKGWYKKGGKRSFFDQQPEDPSATILALLTAYDVTKNKNYLAYACNAFSWFLGNNLRGIPLYNYKTSGVHDGLLEDGVNKNQGAESLVSYLLARIRIESYY